MFPTFGPDVSGGVFDPTKLTTVAAMPATDLSAASGSGTGADFNGTTGTCFAVQSIGTINGPGGTIDGKIQHSDDNASWSDVSGGAFTQVSASNNLQTVTFTRTKRYLRYSYTIGGALPTIPTCCLIVAPNQ
jgi:hypothetical protein